MSRFNTKNSIANKTVNLAGGEAYVESPKLELVSILLTSFVKDQYYRSGGDSIKQISNLIDQISDKRFVAKAAIYARTEFGMRSISHVVAAELADKVRGVDWTKNFFDKVIYRPDDMTEILAYIYNKGGKESNPIRKGFAKAFGRFDEYQLAKYKKDGADVSLIDVANIVHPIHTEAVSKLIKGTLPTPKTWETQLTKVGQTANEDNKEELKAQAWTELIKTRKLGYFALLRNLRNILEQAPDVLDEALEMLTDPKLIRSSLVLPFRFQTALEEIGKVNTSGVRKIIVALGKALDISLQNVPVFPGKTLVALDTSGSMNGQPQQIGALFAATLYKSNEADFMYFNDGAWYQSYNPLDATLTISNSMKNLPSGGTNFNAIFDEANQVYDRIIILSDMQAWVGWNVPTASFNKYKTRCGANPKIYSFDLQGYGTLQFPEDNIFAIAGFSEKIFDVMKLLEQDKAALIHEIEKIEL